MRRLSVLLLWSCLLAPVSGVALADDTEAASTAGIGSVEVELTPSEITIGDHVQAKITLVWMGQEPTAEPRFPTWQETWGNAEVLGVGDVDSHTDQTARRIYRQTLTLTAFETGEVRLPRVTVAVPFETETLVVTTQDERYFEVKSVLPAEATEGAEQDESLEARDAAALVDLAAGPRFLWIASELGVLCLLMAWWLGRRLTVDGRRQTAPVRLGPLEELFQRVRSLDPAAAEPAHTGISSVLRDFLAHTLAFPAPESTTSEIQRRLRATRVSPEVAQIAVRLLRDCDQVKFAALDVDEALTSSRLAETRELARAIDTHLRPPEPAPEAAG